MWQILILFIYFFCEFVLVSEGLLAWRVDTSVDFFLRPTPLLFVFNYCFQVLAEICLKRWKKLLEKKTKNKKNCRIYKAKNMFYPTP